MISLRLSEWSSVDASRVPIEVRRSLSAVLDQWLETQPKNTELPLQFSGPTGERLNAANFAGVVEVPGLRVEIFPKLDAALVAENSQVSSTAAANVLRNLAWMIEASNFDEITASPPSAAGELPDCYMDWLAWLFADRLCRELSVGVHRAYEPHEGHLTQVRGRINFSEQIRQQGWRRNRLACNWDEFTSDTALNRIFRAAVTLLQSRTRFHVATCALAHCDELLAEVRECTPYEALQSVPRIVLDRQGTRFDPSLHMAKLLLGGGTLNPYASGAQNFVFLIDMNRLFEAFAGAALRQAFSARMGSQTTIGHLFRLPSRLEQIADFTWRTQDGAWVADAKYKRIGGLGDVAPADVRQLITYGRIYAPDQARRLLVVYPTVGVIKQSERWRQTFDGAWMASVPLYLDRPGCLEITLPYT